MNSADAWSVGSQWLLGNKHATENDHLTLGVMARMKPEADARRAGGEITRLSINNLPRRLSARMNEPARKTLTCRREV